MAQQVCAGAMMTCSFGTIPTALIVIPKGMPVLAGGPPAATIMDFAPIANIPTFGMCNTISNPVVAASTAAKLGVFTPMPCVPATPAPWLIGAPTVLINNFPALNSTSKCMCMWGGVIQFVFPGQVTVQVP